MKFENEKQAALAAVRQAAQLCQAVQGTINAEALEKKDKSPVTIADFGSQALVCRALREAFPEDIIIAEEGAEELRSEGNASLLDRMMEQIHTFYPEAQTEEVLGWIDHGNHREGASRFWTLDPIDGTKGFLRGDQYAISLGLIENGEVVFGVLACPNMARFIPEVGEAGAVFVASKGEGVTVQSLAGGEPMGVRVSGLQDSAKARFCESFESGHSDHSWSSMVADDLGITVEGVRMDSQAKYGAVAMGAADIYLRLPTRPDYREKIWDHAAGVLVVEEAGGRVTDVDGKPLDFSRGFQLEGNRGVIVSGTTFHERIVKAVLSAEQQQG